MRSGTENDVTDALDVEALREVLREHPVDLAVLFGSHATGTAHSGSDVDVAVELEDRRPSDPEYNDAFLALSVDLSDALDADDVDLVDVRTVSPSLAASVFDRGVLLVGDRDHADDLREQLTRADADERSPRERFDAALARIDAHLDRTDDGVPAGGDSAIGG